MLTRWNATACKSVLLNATCKRSSSATVRYGSFHRSGASIVGSNHGGAVRSRHNLAVTSSSSLIQQKLLSPSSLISQQQTQTNNILAQRRSVFIQTETPPNPESLKFVPTGRVVLELDEDGTSNGYYVTKNDSKEDILRSPLASALFKVDGVKAVYLGSDFVTITKNVEEKWQLLRPLLFSALMDFFDNPNSPKALLERPLITDTTILDDDDEIVAMIKELIEERIRPAVQEDGGDIRYVNFDEVSGLVTVQLAGSCVGCPSSSITLKQGVENMLMHYIPEVTAVEALEEEDEDSAAEAEPVNEEETKQKSYEERLKQAGIPFSD